LGREDFGGEAHSYAPAYSDWQMHRQGDCSLSKLNFELSDATY